MRASRVLRNTDYLSKPEGETIKWIEDHSEGLAFIYFGQEKHKEGDRITKITQGDDVIR